MRLKTHSNHQPRKRFGQNFLQDKAIICDIISAFHPKIDDRVIEIGPGLGALTKLLLENLKHLDVIEIDRDLALELRALFPDPKQLAIHNQDVLAFDLKKLYQQTQTLKKFRIIGNLPYNISTPLIFHLLESSDLISDMIFMLQREVVERLCAKPLTKHYGRLSVMIQYHCEAFPLFSISPEAFYPKPKVTSQLVQLIPHQTPPYPVLDKAMLRNITTAAFNHRRKTIHNALKSYLKNDDFLTLNIDPMLRPEALSLEQFVNITNFVVKEMEKKSSHK